MTNPITNLVTNLITNPANPMTNPFIRESVERTGTGLHHGIGLILLGFVAPVALTVAFYMRRREARKTRNRHFYNLRKANDL